VGQNSALSDGMQAGRLCHGADDVPGHDLLLPGPALACACPCLPVLARAALQLGLVLLKILVWLYVNLRQWQEWENRTGRRG
jgi:hypothetical protein